jgi:hypothetical protein
MAHRYNITLLTAGEDCHTAIRAGTEVHTTYFGGQDTNRHVLIDNVDVGDKICIPQFPTTPLEVSAITLEEV